MIYFKELTHAILGAGKSEIYRAERTDILATQAGVDAAVLRQNFLFSGKVHFLLLRPPTDWMKFTHVIKGILLYLNLTASTNYIHSNT